MIYFVQGERSQRIKIGCTASYRSRVEPGHRYRNLGFCVLAAPSFLASFVGLLTWAGKVLAGPSISVTHTLRDKLKKRLFRATISDRDLVRDC
jgi:hypothetical protein